MGGLAVLPSKNQIRGVVTDIAETFLLSAHIEAAFVAAV